MIDKEMWVVGGQLDEWFNPECSNCEKGQFSIALKRVNIQ